MQSNNTDWNKIREDFPTINSRTIDGKKVVYLDSACQSLRPRQVTEAVSHYYNDLGTCNGSEISAYALSRETQSLLDHSRRKMAQFIHSRKESEIIWQPNTTYAINLVVMSLSKHSCPDEIKLTEDDNVITTDLEHHSGLLPYWNLEKEKGTRHRIFETDSEGKIDLQKFQDFLDRKTKLVSIVWASNLTGTIAPLKEITKIAHDNNSLVVVDGAQYVPHHAVDVSNLDVDFLAFSVHKMCGPSGVGVLYAKEEIAKQMPPVIVGGETVSNVSIDPQFNLIPTFRDPPDRFEPGLQNFAGIIGAGSAVDYLLEQVGMQNIEAREKELIHVLIRGLETIPEIEILGPKVGARAPLVAFRLRSRDGNIVDGSKISSWMDSNLEGHMILLRTGGHEVHPFHYKIGIESISTTRPSLYFYNTEEELTIFLDAMK